MEKDGACKIDRQNKYCISARKSARKKSNAGTDREEEKKLAGPLAKTELTAEGCSRRNGKWEERSQQKKMIYGVEIWTLRRNEQKRLEPFEITIWRILEHVKWTE